MPELGNDRMLLLLLLLLLLLTPNKILKKTENRILLSISGLGPSTDGKDPKKRGEGLLVHAHRLCHSGPVDGN